MTAEQIGIRNTFTIKTLTANGSNFTCLARVLVSGAKINTSLGYYAKIRIRSVNVVTYIDAFQQVQNIERVLGSIPSGIKYFSGQDALNYDKYSALANFTGYNLVRIDNTEATKSLIGKPIEISTAVPNQDTFLTTVLPPVLDGQVGYAYLSAEITLNALNADYFSLGVRQVGGDEFIEFSRADIGKKKRVQFVRTSAALSVGAHCFLIATSRAFTGGVAGVGLDGGGPTVNLTINSFSHYASQNFLPTSYHADFFDEAHTEDLLTGYAKLPVQTVIINEYGDSISEHNYAKFIACNGYDFKINIYGLRGPVSEISSGPGTGACATFGVMTDVADAVLTMFGTHDWGKNAPIGAIGTLDKTTYIGAYEVMLRGLIDKYPGKLIIPVSMPPRGSTSTDLEFFQMKTPTGVTVRDYVNALRDLCNAYGLPFVDAFAASGANQLTMTGHPNLYVPGTTIDNVLLDAAGASTVNASYFTSDFISVAQGKTYGTPLGVYFSEWNGSTFIRRSPANQTKLYLHPSTTQIRLSVSKTETVIANTTIGVGPARFWFADQVDAYMPDRIHPSAICQARIGAAVSSVLKPILDARRRTALYAAAIYNNAD